MKKLKHLFMLCLFGTISIGANAEVYSGSCGDNAQWSFDTTTGLLSITGSGNMSDYSSSSSVPWYNYRSSIESLSIGDLITSIGEGAFDGCSGLTSVTIGNSVTSIGSYAFSGCGALTSIEIPNSVTSIGYAAFQSCSGLTNPVYNNTIFAYMPTSYSGSYSIPNGITTIAEDAFDGCSGLRSVTIPNSVTSIGESAFSYCSKLTSVTIPESVTSIGKFAFFSCSGLRSVTIPNSVTSIGSSAFYCCSGLTNPVYNNTIFAYMPTSYFGPYSIPDGITTIAGGAFGFCLDLTSVTIPNSVTSIGGQAFSGCSGLTSVTIPNSVTSIGYAAFQSCSGLTSIVVESSNTFYDSRNDCNAIIDTKSNTLVCGCKNTIIPNSVTSIGERAFSDCSKLTSVTIPNSVTSIGQQAFSGCSGLTSVTIPNSVTSIGSAAFQVCSGLTSVKIGNSVKTIGDAAFNYSGLTSVTIPNSVTSIGSAAFQVCSGLTSIYVGWKDADKIPTISSYDFPYSQCDLYVPVGTKEIYHSKEYWKTFKNIIEYVPESPNIEFVDAKVKAICVTNWDANDDGELSEAEAAAVTDLGTVFKDNIEITSFNEFKYFTGVTSIGNDAFRFCSGLTSVTIPNSVIEIGWSAFCFCSGLTSVTIPNSVTSIGAMAFRECSGLTSVSIPNSVTSIGDQAFLSCSGLTSVTIPNSVTSICESVFWGCSGLTSVVVETGNTVYDSRDNCNAIIETASNTLIRGCKNTIIPNSVTSIGNDAFNRCYGLTSVTIPNSVTEIGWATFEGCSDLTSIIVESGNTVYDSRENCNAIIETSSNTLISGCKNTIIPNSVTSIGDNAFDGCSGLTSVRIPNSVTSIGDFAFFGCYGLTSVTIPNSVTSIGDDAFQGCSGLTNVRIPNSVTSIGYHAFYSCSGLTSVTIPNSVTSIGDDAFDYCSGLTSVYVGWKDADKIPSLSTSSYFPYSTCDLYVPAGTKNLYSVKNGWKSFRNIIEYAPVITCTSVSLNSESKTLTIGETFNLTATILPEDATDKSITWSSDNEGVATVVDGLVTAVAVGTANINATTNDGSNLSAACAITVTSKTSGDEPSGDDPIDNPTYDNMLLTDDIMGFVGETCVLPVKMNNIAEISAVQFDLCLPEGITIAQDEDGFDLVELGERSTTQKHKTIETAVQPDGAIRVMCASSKNLTFDGNEGTILYITLNVADNLTDGEYIIQMKDVILSTASSTGYEQPLFASKIKVSSYEMGDLNKDHNINVIDYTAMCSMIMETDGGRYPLELADFSGNGKVDVTDLTALVNKIMTSTASAAKPEMTFKAKTAVAPDANRLSLIPFAINPGETKELSLQMFNTDEISAYQTDLVLPEGIEVVKEDGFYLIDLSTKRTTARKHSTMESELQVDGSIRIMCASTNNNTFSGTEGEVAIITVKASETLKPGVYEIQLKNNVLSTAESSGFEPADCESSALVGSPEIVSLSLNGDFTADAIAEYNTALASNTKVAAMDFCNATSVDATTKIATGNKNLLVYVAEGMSIVNEDNAVIGDECANLVLTDGYAFCAPKEFTAAKASYTRAATNGLGTLCLPFAAKSVAGNLYELTSAESNKLTFAPVEEAKANTPYLYRSESAVIEETNAMVEAEAECEIVKGDWTMTGAYSVNVFSGEDNVFALYDGKLYKNTGTLTVTPFRAYFTTTGSASKAEILIDTPTGISNVNINENDNENENYYNLNGVRVGKGYRGIVIKNGEKFIMK